MGNTFQMLMAAASKKKDLQDEVDMKYRHKGVHFEAYT